MIATEKDTTYLNQRLQDLGITHQQLTFVRTWRQAGSEQTATGITTTEQQHTREYQLLDADEEGNIIIRYFNQHGQPYRWKKEDTKQSRDFTRKRLREPKGDMKYQQEQGSPQFPWFPPAIIQQYNACKAAQDAEAQDVAPRQADDDDSPSIHTLFLVEGEIKALKASLCGIDIIGLPSIHGFYNGDIKGRLHEDIEDVIVTCRVQKIIFLVDADLLSLKWAADKDLARRPMNFYGSVKAFRESLQHLVDNENIALELVYFMHIKGKYMHEAKGLDDLLSKYSAKTLEIVEDLHALQNARQYFHGMMINDISKDIQGKLFKYLGLADEQEFYKTYSDFIGAREFKFKRRRYIFNDEKKEVVFVRHEDAEKFMRIGPDWVKVISKLNKYGEEEQEIVAWKISEIQRDYKKFPDFLEQIMKYDDFCNEPNWNGSYQRVIKGCYNLCEPLTWKPAPGSIKHTIKFLKHIFQGTANITLDADGNFESETAITGDPFTVAMDYLTILIKHPKHMLPVPILVSPENGTGKSTFLKWMQLMFGANMCILGNEQFKMKFNGHYITKFIIAIDEGFLEVDKKAEKERLKQLVTADSAYLENKGMNVRKINYFGKLIICSNDADRVMKIDEGESRWFVVRVPQIPRITLTGKQMLERGYKNYKGEEIDPAKTYEVMDADPDLERKLKEEMPAFIHYIYNRAIHHPRVNRLWFDPEWFITDQFKLIVETTKNRIDRVFEDWIREQFLLYKEPVLRYSLKYLTEVFNDQKNSKYKMDSIELKQYLTTKGMELEAPQRIRIPVGFDLPEEASLVKPKIIYQSVLARPYVFVPEKWLRPEQMPEYKKPLFDETGQLVTKISEATPSAPNSDDDLPF